jgi:RNA polymerase primary sigma factor/RNA polymerase nonessential primary-like sigma factor
MVELRYGIVNAREHTLREVADRLGVSRERVRQIKKQAMERLRRRRAKTSAAAGGVASGEP